MVDMVRNMIAIVEKNDDICRKYYCIRFTGAFVVANIVHRSSEYD